MTMKPCEEEGFSLIELLLVVSLLGAVSASVGFMFIGGLRTWNVEEEHSELLHNNLGVMTQVSEAVEQARNITVADPRQIEFTVELGQAAGTELGVRLFQTRTGSWRTWNGNSPDEIPAGTAILDLLRFQGTNLLAAGNDGYVYRSTDGGRSWVRVKLGDSTEVRNLVSAGVDLYAATANKGDVYKSSDGAVTWANTAELEDAVTVRSLAAAPDGTVWAGTDWTGACNLFRTTDAGGTWMGISVFPPAAGTWAYRVPVIITNGSAQNLVDYQVRIPVDFVTSKMLPDFSDLRFRDAAGTDLPYWLEARDPGVSAVAWVRIPFIISGGSVTIYMYYGNSTAVDASDVTTTMDPVYMRYDVPYQWTPKVTTSSLVSSDDGGSWVDLSYQFPYWREFDNRIYACSNGYLSLGDTYGDDDGPQTNAFRRRSMIAPFWEDLRTDQPYGMITEPGLFVDEYEDHTVFTYYAVSFERWRARRVRYRAELVFQAITYRNGDIRFNYQLIRNARRMDPVVGVSKGDNTNYIDISGDIAQGRSFLFGIRRYVDPEPTVVFGEEESLGGGSTDVLALCYESGILYAGTSGGDVLSSDNGGTGWVPTAELTDAASVHKLFQDSAGVLFAGTEPSGVVFRTTDQDSSWATCAPLAGAQQVRAIDATLEKRLICGACPTGLVYTSFDTGASWTQFPGISGVSAVYSFSSILDRMGFSWTGNEYRITGDRSDMVMRTVGNSTNTVDNGYTSDLLFEYFNADMSPADTSTPFGISQIAVVRISVESSVAGLSVSDSVSISLRNRQ